MWYLDPWELLLFDGGTEGTIGVDEPAVIDKRVDTRTHVQTVSTLTVHREVMAIGDPTTDERIADVINAVPAGTEDGLVVRQAGALPTGTNNIGDVDVLSSALPTGAATSALQLPNSHDVTVDNAAGASAVNIQDGGNSITVDGTVTVNQGASATTAWEVQGDVAHDGTPSTNPVLVGGHVLAHGANPTAVAAADVTRWHFNRAGVPWVIGGHPNVITIEYRRTDAGTDTALVTVAGGLKIVVTRVSATVSKNVTAAQVGVRVGFGATTLPAEPATGTTATGLLLSHDGIAAGSGVVEGNGAGILGVGADGEDLRCTNDVPTGGELRVVVSYYTIDS